LGFAKVANRYQRSQFYKGLGDNSPKMTGASGNEGVAATKVGKFVKGAH
jgi:hypothetical protein